MTQTVDPRAIKFQLWQAEGELTIAVERLLAKADTIRNTMSRVEHRAEAWIAADDPTEWTGINSLGELQFAATEFDMLCAEVNVRREGLQTMRRIAKAAGVVVEGRVTVDDVADRTPAGGM